MKRLTEMTNLIDQLGRRHTYLRVAVTSRCNLRCTYCTPGEAICSAAEDDALSAAEIVRICRVFSDLGITKIRLTGGEPLEREDIVELAATVASLPGIEQLGITTNGVELAPLAGQLSAAGVSRVNISIDSLSPERFARITLRPELDRVLAGIESALSAGFEAVRLNVVVIPDVNDDEVAEFTELTCRLPLSVRFIEHMPVGQQWGQRSRCIPSAQLLEQLRQRYTLEPVDGPGTRHNVAREYRIPGHAGSVAFISAVTDHFCGGCNRMRITARGSLKTCLHYPAELDLAAAMRTGADDTELEQLIAAALLEKRGGRPLRDSLPEELASCLERSAMFEIGG